MTWLRRTGLIGAALLALAGGSAARAHATHVTPLCKSGYYKNVDGTCVHRPVKAKAAPAGATAECRDGTYSFSKHASGTCSGHHGVAVWIHHP
ncbi:MAG TPA: DUF3761 domain-containing protein [Gaiellaceae bacterium]|nr:DUF3761 domain-containing protein [Gaiellaceae bacterium]